MTGAIKHRPAAELFGVRRPAGNARERLLDKAIDLFYQHGFHAVGLDQVIAETGVTKTTFYKHFESKDDLVVAAIRRRDEWESRAWDRAVRKLAGDDPRGRLLAVFDVMDAWFNDPAFRGCIFINAAAEFADPREPAHQAAAEHKKRARDEWRDLARGVGAADAEAFANQYAALVEGALVMRHVHRRDDAARFMKPLAKMLIDSHAPPADAAAP
jgi:AcrR family transcriptional regulator